jgi:hypothetical protein
MEQAFQGLKPRPAPPGAGSRLIPAARRAASAAPDETAAAAPPEAGQPSASAGSRRFSVGQSLANRAFSRYASSLP